ncbi:MAG: hypothetical protein AB7D51_09765 [Desulfovibrionaceae bacterium]
MSTKLISMFCAIILVCSLVSCAKKPVLTREESLALRQKHLEMTQRTYSQKTPDEVLVAVDNILRLADGDYEIFHSEKGLIAKRRWSFYAVLFAAFGQDTWYISTEYTDSNSTNIEIRVVSQSQGVAPMATTNGGWTATTLPSLEDSVLSEPLYQLFYSRLDYLLGVSDIWYDCKIAKDVFDVTMKNHVEPLCFCADDENPDEHTEE